MISVKEIKILEAVFKQVRKIIDADCFYAALYDRVNVQLDFPIIAEKNNGSLEMVPKPGAEPKAHPYRPAEQVPDFLLVEGKPLLIETNLENWIASRGLRYDLKSDGLPASWLGVPLFARGRAVGTIVLERYTGGRAFETRDLQFLSAIANRASGTLSNTRLMESLRIVNEIGQALTSEVRLSVEGILSLIHGQLGRLMNVSDMYVALYDRGTQMLSFPFAMYDGEREYDWPSRKVEDIQGLTEAVLLDPELKPLNPANVAQWYKENHITPRVKPVPKSWVGVPLVSGKQVLGVLSLQNDDVEGLYGGDDIEVLTAVAGQAAVALANTRLVERLSVVNEVGQALAAGIDLSLDEILELVYEQTGRLMDTRNMYIAMYDQNTQDLSFPFAMYDGKRHQFPSRKVSGVQGLTEAVLLDPELKPLNPPGVAKWYEDKGINPKVDPIPQSWVGVPIISGEHILGVIALQNDDVANLYDENDVDILKTLAGESAVAIENARLYEDLNHANRNLSDLNENLEKRVQERTRQLAELNENLEERVRERTQQLAELNENLEERVRERTQQLAALQDISIKVTSQLNLEEVLSAIAENANTFMAADFSTLFSYNAEQAKFELGVRRGNIESQPGMPSNEGLAAKIVTTQESQFVTDPQASEDQLIDTPFVQSNEVKSYAGIPLVAHGKTVGLLYINYLEPYSFSGEEREMLELFANQAAVAIENAHLYQDVERRQKETQSLYTMSSELTKSLDLDTVLSTIYHQVQIIEDAPSFFIALCDENLTELDFRLFYDQGASYPEGCIKRPIQSDKHWSDYIVRTREPLFLTHISQQQDRVPVKAVLRGQPGDTPESYMGVPLIAGDKVIGVMSAQNYEPNAYDDRDFELFSALANQAAIVIANVQAYENLENRNQQLNETIEELKKAQARIAESEAASVRNSFAADFVHRINNLAGTIPIWVDLIRQTLIKQNILSSEVEQYLDEIHSDTVGLLREAEQLRYPQQKTSVNVASMLQSIMRQINIQYRDEIKTDVSIEKGLFNVYAVTSSLASSLWNLISNAVDAILPKNKGELIVRANNYVEVNGSRWIKLEIQDTGVGISTENMEKIFDPFFTTKHEGRGYGLWRTKTVIDELGGNIEVESQAGIGTLFTIILPGTTKEKLDE